jgi:hypothetical protein
MHTMTVTTPAGKRVTYHLAPCPFSQPHECNADNCTETATTAIHFHDDHPSFPCVCAKHANPDTWEW